MYKTSWMATTVWSQVRRSLQRIAKEIRLWRSTSNRKTKFNQRDQPWRDVSRLALPPTGERLERFAEFTKNQGQPDEFDGIRIGLASPEMIRAWSFGEAKNLKPLINYRTFKPEREGPSAQRFFGPVKDYECL